MIRFSEEAWQHTAALREAIHALPFNTELAAGTLARGRFQHYIVQDALYLGQFSRTLAIAASSEGTYRPSIQAPPRGSNTAFISSTTKETSPPRRKTAEIIRVRATVQA